MSRVSSWPGVGREMQGVSRCRVGVEVWCRGVEARAQRSNREITPKTLRELCSPLSTERHRRATRPTTGPSSSTQGQASPRAQGATILHTCVNPTSISHVALTAHGPCLIAHDMQLARSPPPPPLHRLRHPRRHPHCQDEAARRPSLCNASRASLRRTVKGSRDREHRTTVTTGHNIAIYRPIYRQISRGIAVAIL